MSEYMFLENWTSNNDRIKGVLEKYHIAFRENNGAIFVVCDSAECQRLAWNFQSFAREVGLTEAWPIFDHERYLKTEDGKPVVLYSPYQGSRADWKIIQEEAPKNGFEVMELGQDEWLYSPGCDSYLIRRKR